MSVKEVCAYFNISHDTLKRWRDVGKITPIPGNPHLLKEPLRFRREDVERLAPPRPKP